MQINTEILVTRCGGEGQLISAWLSLKGRAKVSNDIVFMEKSFICSAVCIGKLESEKWKGGRTQMSRDVIIKSSEYIESEPGSSVSIVSGYGLDDRVIRCSIPGGDERIFPLASVP
jgi:hypothetical protein